MTEAPTHNTILSKQTQLEDQTPALRPYGFSEYIGQSSVVSRLQLMIQAAQARKEGLEHVLFHGPPGLGKTSLAYVVGHELKVRVVVTSGPALERTGDLAAILTQLKARDILFIDEIHRLSRGVEEMLYPAMEDYRVDLIIGQGPMAKTTSIPLQRYTLIGATTRAGLMTAPLRDRFGAAFRLNFYDTEALSNIVLKSATRLKMDLTSDGAEVIASRSRGTPRIANRLVRRVRDYGHVHKITSIDEEVAKLALDLFEVDTYGCDPMDRTILSTLIQKFSGGPVGIETLASALSEDVGTLEDYYEPYLIQLGFIKRTPRGRVATEQAYSYLGMAYEQSEHPTLL